MSTVVRTLVAAAAAIVLTAGPAAAAPAAPLPVDVDFYTAPGGYHVSAHCALVAGYSTDPRFINWVVVASAEAAGPSVPVATSVQCTVYDALDKSRTYGGASSGLPGPTAVAVGQATVPVGRVPAVCVNGGATFLNGTTMASSKPCP